MSKNNLNFKQKNAPVGQNKHVSVSLRTCIGCRGRAGRNELLRLVANGAGGLEIDMLTGAPGRGAWIHPDLSCLRRADRQRSFTRALRQNLDWDLDQLLAQVLDIQDHRCAPCTLQMTNGSGLEADGHPMSTQR